MQVSQANICHLAVALRALSFLDWPDNEYYDHYVHRLLRKVAEACRRDLVLTLLHYSFNIQEASQQQDALATLGKIEDELGS